MKIGLFGGTFNPIHNGHLIVAQTVLDQLKLDKIIFLPSGDPPHKDQDAFFSKEDRYNMVSIAISSNLKFFISPLEMLSEYVYSYQTIEYFSSEKDSEIFFIIGMDSLNNLHNWKKGYELLDMCKFVVVGRPDNKQKLSHENITFIKDVNIGISGTMIRNMLKHGQSIKYLVPREIESYVKQIRL